MFTDLKLAAAREFRDGNALDWVKLCNEQAVRCARLLQRDLEPRRRALVEQEHLDWVRLAGPRRTWVENADNRAPATSLS